MSTILKALKKLEQDKDAFQAGGIPPGYMGPGSPHVQPRHGFGRLTGPLVRRGVLLLIILCLGSATFYFYRQSRVSPAPTPTSEVAQKRPAIKSAPPSKSQSVVQTAPQAAASPPVNTSPTKSANSKEDVTLKPSPVPKKLPVGANSGKTSAQPLPANKPRRTVQPRPAPLEWQSLKELARPGKAIATQPSEDVDIPVSPTTEKRPRATPVAAKPVPPPVDAYNDVAPLNDGRLKVQAIAWSPVVEDRMAVINARIVHEGDKVDGFFVLAIRHDDVVVREKGALYRVVFGRP